MPRIIGNNEPEPLRTMESKKKQSSQFNSGPPGLDPAWVQMSEEVGELTENATLKEQYSQDRKEGKRYM